MTKSTAKKKPRPLMVAMMVWGVIPAIQGRFHRFINPLAG